jgi:phosphopantothenoylcysteine decarboxylase/phosphopantothenate--cysteine ligase
MLTAGPTLEKIDPVRFIGNFSSGKMGYALAHELAARGAKVTLISGPSKETTNTSIIKKISVQSAQEMANACLAEAGDADVWIFCAAVADYTPAHPSTQKTKKTGASWNIELTETVDIAAALGAKKLPHQKAIGFALESGDGADFAQEKLKRKNLDLVCLNSLDAEAGSPLGADDNSYRIFGRNGLVLQLPHTSKRALASQLIDVIETL